jgi:phospho-N-acetylmuramoyl-pentapeptide-transferase
VISLLISAAVGLIVSIFGTPYVIRILERRRIGQFIQEELASHAHKQGIPTMGGVVFVSAAIIGYLLSHIRIVVNGGPRIVVQEFHAGGLSSFWHSLGWLASSMTGSAHQETKSRPFQDRKFGGQLAVAALCLGSDERGAVTRSCSSALGIDLGVFCGVVLLLMTGFANGVNLTDGMDGLAAGRHLSWWLHTVIAFWQFRNPQTYARLTLSSPSCRRRCSAPRSAFVWNAHPAKITAGDVGSCDRRSDRRTGPAHQHPAPAPRHRRHLQGRDDPVILQVASFD